MRATDGATVQLQTNQIDPTATTPERIRALSYPDFLGLINQWNVPPGALSTLSSWALHSRLGPSSRVLEIACTTGFSLRELATLTGCGGVGFDISAASVDKANRNRLVHAPDAAVNFVCADAYAYEPSELFSHFVLGASLKSLPDPARFLARLVSWMGESGYFLVSPFYTRRPLPPDLVAQARSVFGFTPTLEPYKEMMRAYRDFEIVFEERRTIERETEDELRHYCSSTVSRACQSLGVRDDATRQAIGDRLGTIRAMSNTLRPYQEYAVLVLRYRRSVYPNRYVELF